MVFTRLALQGFGAVLPVAQHELVERRAWVTREEFAEILSVGQIMPGPNIINMSLMIGDKLLGRRGAFAAMLGMVSVPFVVVLAVAALYAELAHVPAVAGALRGMGAVSAGLIAGSTIKLAPAMASSSLGKIGAGVVAIAALLLAAWLRVPIAAVILGLGALSCGAAWAKLGRR
jgi:chromate transporter